MLRRLTVLLAGSLAVTFAAACSGESKRAVEVVPTVAATFVTIPSATERVARPTSTPSSTPSPEDVVLAAYGRYWDVYSQALLTLDPNLVQDVVAGPRLKEIQDEIDGLSRQGLAARINVTHNPLVVELGDESATIYDEMTNNSFYVDSTTKQPERGTGSGETFRDAYRLRKLNGVWKVVESSRLVTP